MVLAKSKVTEFGVGEGGGLWGVGYMYLHHELSLQVRIFPLSNSRGKWIFFSVA